jgi:hypothetical protein
MFDEDVVCADVHKRKRMSACNGQQQEKELGHLDLTHFDRRHVYTHLHHITLT